MKLPKVLISLIALAGAIVAPALLAAGREPPVPVRTVAPEYPRELKNQGVSGIVMVKVTIDDQGNVAEVSVAKSSNEAFDKFATEALKKWKFKPAKQDGEAVSMQVTIPIKFVAEES
ncbi:MAG TPA: energy transducer TonB [Opitutus sp.]|nr:energy transducer TonB [Opitutus sp.]